MQHKIRKEMEDRDEGYKQRGLIEVDEGYVGHEEHGAAGQPGRTPIPGFAALSAQPNAGSKSLDGFLKDKIESGSHARWVIVSGSGNQPRTEFGKELVRTP